MIPYFSYVLPCMWWVPRIQQVQTEENHVQGEKQREKQGVKRGNQGIKRGQKCLELLEESDVMRWSKSVRKEAWSEAQDLKLKQLVDGKGLSWEQVSAALGSRSAQMCYSRYRRVELGRKRAWKAREDAEIVELVGIHGPDWKRVSVQLAESRGGGSGRTAKQIRERYFHYLRPGITRAQWTPEEDLRLLRLVTAHRKTWKKFEDLFPGRTENQIKNRFYGKLKRAALHKRKLLKTQP